MYNQSHVLKNLIKDKLTIKDKIVLILFFSVLGIISNYTGVSVESYTTNSINHVGSMAGCNLGVHDAIANTRPIAAIVSGYIGGPLLGAIVGLIAGTHRYLLGGFTALSCGIATIVEGIIGGIAKKHSKDGSFNIKQLFIAAVIAENFQMIIILAFYKPFFTAIKLIKIISIPMILINSLGSVIFISIIKNAKEEYNKIGAVEAQKALNIAKRTMKYMRKGLSKETAKNISKIIYEMANIEGIFIGDKNGLLTYYGIDIDQEKLKKELCKYYKIRDYMTIRIDSIFFVCAPFNVVNSGFEGMLGLGLKYEKNISTYFIQFVEELRDLLSNQIEIYKLNKLAEEASTAEFKALRAQIEPHFLFNALNTIS